MTHVDILRELAIARGCPAHVMDKAIREAITLNPGLQEEIPPDQLEDARAHARLCGDVVFELNAEQLESMDKWLSETEAKRNGNN
jgi:hypothetical protein